MLGLDVSKMSMNVLHAHARMTAPVWIVLGSTPVFACLVSTLFEIVGFSLFLHKLPQCKLDFCQGGGYYVKSTMNYVPGKSQISQP